MTTRDYFGMIEECENGGMEVPTTGDVRVCTDCARPAYYDNDDDAYHHAVDANRGCFLIAAEDRADDTAHPLVTK